MQVGTIYKEDLEEITKSTEVFSVLYARFSDDEQYAPLSCYSIYLNYTDIDNKLEAQNSKQLLLERFPKSIYAQMLTNPDFKLEATNKLAKEELRLSEQFLQIIFGRISTGNRQNNCNFRKRVSIKIFVFKSLIIFK